MIGNISSALSSISRSIATAARSSSFSVSLQKVSLTPVRINSPFSPGNSSLNATRLFTAQNSSLVSGSSRSASLHQPATGGGYTAQSLPDVAQRLIDHLAAHGIQPARNITPSSPLTPSRPAPPPPVSNEASQPLPDIAQRLIDHLAAHGIKTSRNS
ncbi:EspF protein [Escherichia coli]|nr:EspF protein [Escherichia coli]HAM3517679.1 EspF protein [Escherichia coli]HBP8107581.1 EspF protein [Escherichia coli]HCQ4297579.1 EspF protein [Escherichia coli]